MKPLFAVAGRALGRASVLSLLPAIVAAQGATGTLVGRVLSGDVAVPSATIVASNGRATLTRVDGRFRMNVPAGRYEVRAQRIGYSTGRDTVTIRAGETSTLNFRLERAIGMLEAVSSVGTRDNARKVIDALVPIDVIPGAALKATGKMETARMIQSLAPSVNVPRASYAEGSDLIHPVTMRGLAPDQVLVLVNGHRRHTSALLDVNGSVGRGATGVDLDAIPASMIDHVEILRDGASAQYGSDAIAGVINVVLKSGVHGDAMTTVGASATTYNRANDAVVPYPTGERSASDGRALQASVDKGIVFGERGFLHGDLEIRDRAFSNRSLPDLRPQYAPGDPRAGASGLPADRMTHRLGDAGSHDLALFLNGGNLLSGGAELYANGGASRRTMDAAGVYRIAADPRTVRATFPDGFLPTIRPTIYDYAVTVGLKNTLDEWAVDVSTSYGRNRVAYDVANTVAGGLVTPQTEFDAGTVHYGQSLTNLDLVRHLSVFDETRLALGAELRAEDYSVGTASAPSLLIEGFAGFGPPQAISRSRHDYAGYVDVESDISSALTVGLAGRLERYNDVGTTSAGKLTARFEPVRNFVLRASVGRNFRVPSLAQSYYSDVVTDPGTGAFTTRVATVDAAGASPLRPERSMNYTLGVAAEVTRALSLSADLYRIDVKDRIILVDAVTDAAVAAPLYSTNGADTRTDGLDVNANYRVRFDNAGILRLVAGANFNTTSVTRDATSGALGLGRIGLTRLERGQPRSNLLAVANYTLGNFGTLLRTQRFGEVTVARLQDPAVPAQTFSAKWVTDANVSYTLWRKYTFTVGADNLFDVYPDRNNVPGDPAATGPSAIGGGYYGIYPYNAASPFGFNGRFVYGRLSIYL
jgi:iron complex outermembrane receptor protein